MLKNSRLFQLLTPTQQLCNKTRVNVQILSSQAIQNPQAPKLPSSQPPKLPNSQAPKLSNSKLAVGAQHSKMAHSESLEVWKVWKFGSLGVWEFGSLEFGSLQVYFPIYRSKLQTQHPEGNPNSKVWTVQASKIWRCAILTPSGAGGATRLPEIVRARVLGKPPLSNLSYYLSYYLHFTSNGMCQRTATALGFSRFVRKFRCPIGTFMDDFGHSRCHD